MKYHEIHNHILWFIISVFEGLTALSPCNYSFLISYVIVIGKNDSYMLQFETNIFEYDVTVSFLHSDQRIPVNK